MSRKHGTAVRCVRVGKRRLTVASVPAKMKVPSAETACCRESGWLFPFLGITGNTMRTLRSERETSPATTDVAMHR
ncbi:hypothetical protein Sjap_022568 [Stephania japonica]|uniref:Uncharacterized protein n=1 Tax=Stephania japonica TaxID=461633 RepID=A0AAP0EP51_9MAGN